MTLGQIIWGTVGLLIAIALYKAFASTNGEDTPALIVVKGDHVGGHRTAKRLGQVVTRGHNTSLAVKEALSRKAVKRGANALLNYTWHRSRGGHGEDQFWGEAEAAFVERER